MSSYLEELTHQAHRWQSAQELGRGNAAHAAMKQGMIIAAKIASLEYPRTASEIWNEALGRVVL